MSTDKSDYQPGDTVIVTGSGWQPGAAIALTFHEVLDQAFHPDVIMYTFADGAGTVDTSRADTPDDDYVLEAHDLGVKYELTATGLTPSGSAGTATTTFTDAIGLNLDQCQNIDLTHVADPCGTTPTNSHPAWSNGDVNHQNSQYREADGLPYRNAITKVPNGTWVVRLEYDFTKGGKFAIDRLTRYNLTQASNPCLSTGDVTCTLGSPAFSFPIPSEVAAPDATHPALPNSGNLHIAGDGNLNPFPGGTDNLMTVWVDGGSGVFEDVDAFVTQDGLATGDSSREFKFSFTLSGCPDLGCNMMLGWSGHIAASIDWGPNKGAASINGAPFHMRLKGIDHDEGFTGGNQDRSVQLSAIVTTIKVNKVLVPSTDTGTFNLTIDGVSSSNNPPVWSGENVGNGGTTGYVPVSGDVNHTVGETGAGGTNLTNYKTSISCVDSFNQVVATSSTTSVSVFVALGGNVTCTITNTRRATPTVSTDIHDTAHQVITSALAGETVHDSASVSGSAGTPTGTIIFKFYDSSTCGSDPIATSSSFTLSGGSVDGTTFTQGPLASGNYGFKAFYTADSNSDYVDAVGSCEPLSVSKRSTQGLVQTEIHLADESVVAVNTSAPLGSTVHDKATVGNGGTPIPTGTVDFTFYRGGDCTTGTAETASTVSLDSSGVAHPSGGKTSLAAGNYAFKAHYNGDTNFEGGDSGCEPFSIAKGTLTLTTTMHKADHTVVPNGGQVALGTQMHDNAALTGAASGITPTGAVTFKLNGNTLATAMSPDSGFYATSIDSSALIAGNYSFQAAYAGDSNYNAIAAGTHNAETFSVGKATTTTTTTLHNGPTSDAGGISVLAIDGNATSGTVHDSASVTTQAAGSIAITGTVAFRFYQTKAQCLADTYFTGGSPAGSASVGAGGVAHPSDPATNLTAGYYAFRAKYAGDSNYSSSLSACEPFYVSTITVIKNAKPGQGNFAFATTGTGYNSFNLTGATTNDGNKNTQFLAPGTYTAKEGLQLGWILDGIGGDTNQANPNFPYACIATGTSSGVGNLNTQTATITLSAGNSVTCVFENTGSGATRTQGFWATHPQLAALAWDGGIGYNHNFPGVVNVSGIGDKTLCSSLANYNGTTIGKNINSLARLMGGFWSDISKTSGGVKRSNTDQSRMQLLQQLLAAELNASAFGSLPTGGSVMFASWESAYCSGNAQALQTAMQQAASFNTQGDNSTFTPGTSADSKGARAVADIPFWNVLP